MLASARDLALCGASYILVSVCRGATIANFSDQRFGDKRMRAAGLEVSSPISHIGDFPPRGAAQSPISNIED